MKRYLVAGMVAAAAVTLTACDNSAGGDGPLPEDIKTHTVNLPDGRTVLCVFEADGYGGGLSCDWANTK